MMSFKISLKSFVNSLLSIIFNIDFSLIDKINLDIEKFNDVKNTMNNIFIRTYNELDFQIMLKFLI